MPTDGPDLGTIDGLHFYLGFAVGVGYTDLNGCGAPNGSNIGQNFCGHCGGQGLFMHVDGNGGFDLEQIDFTVGAGGPIFGPEELPWSRVMTSFFEDGGTVSSALSSTVWVTWHTLVLTDSWRDLVQLQFQTTGSAADSDFIVGMVDNLVVSNVVPVPAAAWLFGSALLGLGWTKRRKTI